MAESTKQTVVKKPSGLILSVLTVTHWEPVGGNVAHRAAEIPDLSMGAAEVHNAAAVDQHRAWTVHLSVVLNLPQLIVGRPM